MESRDELASEDSFDVCLEGSDSEFTIAVDFYANVLTGMARDDQDICQGATPASIPYGMEKLPLGVILAGFDRD